MFTFCPVHSHWFTFHKLLKMPWQIQKPGQDFTADKYEDMTPSYAKLPLLTQMYIEVFIHIAHYFQKWLPGRCLYFWVPKRFLFYGNSQELLHSHGMCLLWAESSHPLLPWVHLIKHDWILFLLDLVWWWKNAHVKKYEIMETIAKLPFSLKNNLLLLLLFVCCHNSTLEREKLKDEIKGNWTSWFDIGYASRFFKITSSPLQ